MTHYVQKEHRWTQGWPLLLLTCALVTVPLYDRPLGVVAVLALLLILFTPATGHKQAAPKQDGEAEQPTTGKVF